MIGMAPGAMYSVADGEFFCVAKVLAVDTGAVHIRLYKNKFETRPLDVDESTLVLGTIHDADGFGVGHLPLSHADFETWAPVFIKRVEVLEHELEGYQIWKESGGGLWKL